MNSQTLKKPLLQRPRKKVVLKICWNPQPHVLLSSWSNLQTFRSSKKKPFSPKSNSSASPAELCLWCAIPSFWGGSLVFEKNTKTWKIRFLGCPRWDGADPPPSPCSLHPPPPPKSPENLFEPEFRIGQFVSVSSLQWPEGTGSFLGLSLGGNRGYGNTKKTSRSRGHPIRKKDSKVWKESNQERHFFSLFALHADQSNRSSSASFHQRGDCGLNFRAKEKYGSTLFRELRKFFFRCKLCFYDNQLFEPSSSEGLQVHNSCINNISNHDNSNTSLLVDLRRCVQ